MKTTRNRNTIKMYAFRRKFQGYGETRRAAETPRVGDKQGLHTRTISWSPHITLLFDHEPRVTSNRGRYLTITPDAQGSHQIIC